MGAPVLIAAATARSRTGRRILIGAIIAILLVGTLLVSPLLAVPFGVAGQVAIATSSATMQQTAGGMPEVHGEWGYPLADSYTVGRGFRKDPAAGCGYCGSNHEGFDMAQGCGATVFAAGSGRVTVANAYGGYGNAVRIDHGGGLSTIYGHMQWGSLRVHVGEQVAAGTALGTEGNTGHSFGCHLHFEVRLDDGAVDAEPFMAARGLPLR